MRKKEVLTVLLCVTLTIGIIGIVMINGNKQHPDLLGEKTVKGITMQKDESEENKSEMNREIHKLRIDLAHKSFGLDGKLKTDEKIEQLELDEAKKEVVEEILEDPEEIEEDAIIQSEVETETSTENNSDQSTWKQNNSDASTGSSDSGNSGEKWTPPKNDTGGKTKAEKEKERQKKEAERQKQEAIAEAERKKKEEEKRKEEEDKNKEDASDVDPPKNAEDEDKGEQDGKDEDKDEDKEDDPAPPTDGSRKDMDK